MKLIVAVSESWGIGKDNKLLFSLKEDMKFFKSTTMGKIVVMGKNTFLSLPRRPLKDRINIVLSSSVLADECIIASNTDDLFDILRQFDTNEVFIIGGASMYKQMLPYCDTAYVTKVHSYAEADAFFPNLDRAEGWECVEKRDAEDVVPITFCTYKNNNVTEYKL